MFAVWFIVAEGGVQRILPSGEGMDRVVAGGINGQFLKKCLQDVGSPDGNFPEEIWETMCEILFHAWQQTHRVHEWDRYLDDVPNTYKGLVAAVIVKCFGK